MRGAAVKRLAQGECQFGSAIVIEQAEELASKDGQRFALLEGGTGLLQGRQEIDVIDLFVGGLQTLGAATPTRNSPCRLRAGAQSGRARKHGHRMKVIMGGKS